MLGTPSAVQLVDENRYLNDELNRVETVLNLTRAEKDELSIRYNALSDRVSLFLIKDLVNRLYYDSQTLKDKLFCSYFCDKIFPFLIV